jgi:hypothetical protein
MCHTPSFFLLSWDLTNFLPKLTLRLQVCAWLEVFVCYKRTNASLSSNEQHEVMPTVEVGWSSVIENRV